MKNLELLYLTSRSVGPRHPEGKTISKNENQKWNQKCNHC